MAGLHRVVLDTDVASLIFRGRDLEPAEEETLDTRTPVLTFVTIAEWSKWAYKRNWGTARRDRMRTFADQFDLLNCEAPIMDEWGRLQAMAELDGRPILDNDCWIAACCSHNRLPLLTHNRKDFVALSVYGLTLL